MSESRITVSSTRRAPVPTPPAGSHGFSGAPDAISGRTDPPCSSGDLIEHSLQFSRSLGFRIRNASLGYTCGFLADTLDLIPDESEDFCSHLRALSVRSRGT